VGKVSGYAVALVMRQLQETGPVVWFDPGAIYESVLPGFEAKGVSVLRYAGSFLALRSEAEPHLQDSSPPRLVVYVPCEEADAYDALAELTAAGATLRPGHPSYPCNTRLSVVARAALKGVLPDEALEQVLARVETNQLILSDLDRLADEGAADLSTLALVYGTHQPREITLLFLSDSSRDGDLTAKGAIEDLARLVGQEYGANLGGVEDPERLRERLAGHLLTGDCALSLHGDSRPVVAENFVSLSVAQQAAVLELASAWRNRMDLQESYTAHSRRVVARVDLSGLPDAIAALAEVDTFEANDAVLQRLVAESLSELPAAHLVKLAERRQRSFWGRQPENLARWQLIAGAGNLILLADHVNQQLAEVSSASTMVQRYSEGDAPWCEMDTAQRRLERLLVEFEDSVAHPELEKLGNRARDRYISVANIMADRFTGLLERDGFRPPGQRQRDIFGRTVLPLLAQGRVAYILVDALRYEMGRELHNGLRATGESALGAAIAGIPTITEVGMACLMPGAEQDAALVDAGNGHLAVSVNGVVLGSRKQRMDYLKQRAGLPTEDCLLDDLQPLDNRLRGRIKEARLLVVTSQEIDQLGESGNAAQARLSMAHALQMVLRAVRTLTREGFEHFVITADHGHLFGEAVGSSMTIERPVGGKDVDLHRRVWVGHGGTAVPNTLRIPASALGWQSDLDIVTPRTLACFKAGGSTEFHHGGLSLQELIVPLITVRVLAQVSPGPKIEFQLQGPKKITTRVYAVAITGAAKELFPVETRRVRIELSASGRPVGTVLDADYGLDRETGEITLRPVADGRSLEPNHVTFEVRDYGDAKAAEVRLLDAASEQPLAQHAVEVAISL